MFKLRVIAIFLLACFSAHSFADVNADLKEVVVANFAVLAKKDYKAYSSTVTDNAIIIDEFSPFVWTGAGAAENYFKSFVKLPLVDVVVVVKDAVTTQQENSKAFAVYPCFISYKDTQKNASNIEGGYQTVVYTKSTNGKWMIESLSWATSNP